MKTKINELRRLAFGIAALAVGAAAVLPALSGSASAAPLVTSRYVKMSSSSNTATGASYEIGFTTATAGQLRGIVVDFCADSPIIGSATCTAPTGFTVGTPTVAVSAGFTATGSWTGGSLNSGRTLTVTNATNTSIAAATAGTVTVSTVTNPTSAAATFYARIYTYTTTAGATGYTVANPAAGGAVLDNGGAAMSTASSVNVSATVQEQLTFCVSKAAPAAGCTSLSAPDVVLGTGTPKVLTTGAVQTDTAYHQVSTNAASGVIIRLKNTSSTACAGLSRDNGATCGIGATGAFGAIASSAGLFGLNVANGTGGTGTVTADSDYGTTANSYGMANATYGTYGDPISSSTSATTDVNSLLTYAANAAPTTPAGVYTATHSLVATATY